MFPGWITSWANQASRFGAHLTESSECITKRYPMYYIVVPVVIYIIVYLSTIISLWEDIRQLQALCISVAHMINYCRPECVLVETNPRTR